MRRLFISLLVTLLLASGAFIIGTADRLPERVATHFGTSGRANGWMTRDGYLAFILVFAWLCPIAIAGTTAWLPKLAARDFHLPHRDYWLAPGRRGQTLAILTMFGSGLACVVAVFIAALHWISLEANAMTPAQLPYPLFWSVLIAFIAAIGAWYVLLYARFRIPA